MCDFRDDLWNVKYANAKFIIKIYTLFVQTYSQRNKTFMNTGTAYQGGVSKTLMSS